MLAMELCQLIEVCEVCSCACNLSEKALTEGLE